MSNLPNETLLELWEGMFGSNKAAKAEPYTIDYKEFSKRVQDYGDTRELEGRIDEVENYTLKYKKGFVESDHNLVMFAQERLIELTALKDKTHE